MAGRPKIQLKDLPEGWQEKMIALASEGASDVELRGIVLGGICHETWERLIEEESQFSETIKRCKLLCQIWWEKNGRSNLHNKEFGASLWYMNMKNRFGWADNKKVKQESTIKLDIKDVKSLPAEELIKKLNDSN